jgi:transcriptional regulator with XRE-family HTH domain
MTTSDINLLSDETWLSQLGHGLAQQRVRLGMSQVALAQKAGVGKRTVERLEAGESIQSLNLLRILRALGMLSQLGSLAKPTAPSPMDLLKMKSKERQRASSPRTGASAPSTKWKWGNQS